MSVHERGRKVHNPQPGSMAAAPCLRRRAGTIGASAGSMWRKLCRRDRRVNSAICPGDLDPVGPAPTTTMVIQARRTSGSGSQSAISKAPKIRPRSSANDPRRTPPTPPADHLTHPTAGVRSQIGHDAWVLRGLSLPGHVMVHRPCGGSRHVPSSATRRKARRKRQIVPRVRQTGSARSSTPSRTGVRLSYSGIDDIPLLWCQPRRRYPERDVSCLFSTAPEPHTQSPPPRRRLRRHSRQSRGSRHR